MWFNGFVFYVVGVSVTHYFGTVTPGQYCFVTWLRFLCFYPASWYRWNMVHVITLPTSMTIPASCPQRSWTECSNNNGWSTHPWPIPMEWILKAISCSKIHVKIITLQPLNHSQCTFGWSSQNPSAFNFPMKSYQFIHI